MIFAVHVLNFTLTSSVSHSRNQRSFLLFEIIENCRSKPILQKVVWRNPLTSGSNLNIKEMRIYI